MHHLDDVRRFLTTRFPGAAGVAELGGGDWSRAYAFTHDGRELVARFGQHREDYETDREAMAYAGPDLPVPVVLEIGDALDGVYAISERHHGVFLESLDPDGWERVMPALMRGLDAMRAEKIDWPEWLREQDGAADGPGGFWGWQLRAGLIDVPGTRVSGWRAVLTASPQLDALFIAGEREMTALLSLLPTEPHLIHSDLINRNVLVSADATALAAVYDWGCRKYGDFLYDLAWLSYFAAWYTDGLDKVDIRAHALAHYRATGIAVPAFDERMRCYELEIGLEHMAYSAFTGNDENLQWNARRTREVLG